LFVPSGSRLLLCGFFLASCSSALGVDYTFKSSITVGNWSNRFNWDGNAVPSSETTSNIIFNPSSGATTVTLDGVDTTVGNILFNSTTTSTTLDTNIGVTFRTLTLDGAITNPGGKGQTFALPINLTAGSHIFDPSAETIAFLGPIQSSGGIEKTGTGRILLNTANSFTGTTTLTEGTIQLNSEYALQNSTVDTGAIGIRDIVFKSANVEYVFGALAGSLNMKIDSGTVVESTSGIRYLKVGGNNATTTYSGVLSGDMGLTKAGTGIFTITNGNTFTGGTEVTGGELEVNGSTSTTGTVLVNASTTLSGDGVLGGATTISGTHAPGLSTTPLSRGLQDFSSSLSYNAASIFEWNLDTNVDSLSGNGGTTGVRGTNFDAVDVVGNTTINSSAIFKIVLGVNFAGENAFWLQREVWSVFSVAGTKATNFNTFQVYDPANPSTALDVSAYGQFSYAYNTDGLGANSGNLIWTPVPESTSALAGLLLGAGLLRRRRKLA
jgi:autotransporter-associated beta strand protein